MNIYRESLPDNCPPTLAEEVSETRVVYRLVRSNPPTTDHFRSQREKKPDSVFPNIDECQARGLSVYTIVSDCDKPLKLPHFRKYLVCKVSLDFGAGRIQQTGQPSHHTWWPLAGFDILQHCSMEPL
ncbi:MAG: hypothetical protein WCP96_08640 [Methylococcaceae bacterium]